MTNRYRYDQPLSRAAVFHAATEFRATLGEPSVVLVPIEKVEEQTKTLSGKDIGLGIIGVPGWHENNWGVCNGNSGLWGLDPSFEPPPPPPPPEIENELPAEGEETLSGGLSRDPTDNLEQQIAAENREETKRFDIPETPAKPKEDADKPELAKDDPADDAKR